MTKGARLPPGVQYAIGSGPNLVSANESGGSYVDIEGDNVNIIEHASNTGLALKKTAAGTEFSLILFDGEDGCTEYKPTCGVDSRQFALFLLDYLKVDTAMEMDQGCVVAAAKSRTAHVYTCIRIYIYTYALLN